MSDFDLCKETIDISSFVEKAKTLGVLGVKVTQHNELKAEWLSEGECRRNIYSATKSFTSCAMGFAVQEGLISLDEKLTDAFADDIPENPDENLKKATVRDLLTMCLGQESGHLMGDQRPLYKEDDWVKMVLSIPFVYEPGTHFVYNNVGPYLAGILVRDALEPILYLILCRDFLNILKLSGQPGKLILLAIHLVRADCSLLFLSFTNLVCSI